MNPFHSIESSFTIVMMAGNVIWTALNIRMQAAFEKRMREEFCTRVECNANHRLVDLRQTETERRLDRAGA